MIETLGTTIQKYKTKQNVIKLHAFDHYKEVINLQLTEIKAINICTLITFVQDYQKGRSLKLFSNLIGVSIYLGHILCCNFSHHMYSN